jgi:hypothetical protein
MKIQALALALTAAFALSACTEETPAPAPTPAPDAPVTAPAEPAPAPVADPATTAPVAADPAAAPVAADPATAASPSMFANAPSCDAYIKEYTACFENSKMVTPEGLAAAKQGLESSRQAWEMMAKDPAQSAALESACKMVLDSLPQTKTAMGC